MSLHSRAPEFTQMIHCWTRVCRYLFTSQTLQNKVYAIHFPQWSATSLALNTKHRNDKSISFSSKIRLMRFLVTSIFLYACESWTLTVELQKRIQAMEMRCYRKILHISYTDHVTNENVRANRTTRRPPDDRKETQTAVV